MNFIWKLHVYRSWDEIDDADFIRQWERWVHQAPDAHVFNHPALIKTWTDIYRSLEKISPLYIVAEAEDVLVFLPLVLWRRNWKNAFVKTVIPAGYSDYDYHDPVFTAPVDKALIDSFWNMLEEHVLSKSGSGYDIVDIPGIRQPGENLSWKDSEETCPFALLYEFQSYNDYYSKLKKGLRQDIRRQKKRLSETGDLKYHVHSGTVHGGVLESFSLFLSVHRQKWPGSYKAPGFHHKLFQEGASEGLVHFSEMRIDDQPISWHLGFMYKGRFYYYMPAFLDDFARYSPGKVHLSFLVEECFQRGIRVFDHLRGLENYKAGWTNHSDVLYQMSLKSTSPFSLMRLVLFDCVQMMKQSTR